MLKGFQYYAVKLGFVPELPEKIMVSWVRVFPSIEAASKDYHQALKENAETCPLESPGIGDESFVYKGNAAGEVYFRIKNILARVTMYTQYRVSPEDAKQWAEKLEAKIDGVKRLRLQPLPPQQP